MATVPTVSEYMARTVHTIGQEQPLEKAKEIMEKHSVRHLPVQHGGKVVGVLSLRDIQMFEQQEDGLKQAIFDVMTQDPFIVTPDTNLDVVAKKMEQHKYSCVIIAVEDKVQGIFTYVDALRALIDAYQRG